MSTNITFNGTSYTVPALADASWGTNVANYLIAIASGCLQKTGGTFTLSAADIDFGGTYGLKAVYFKSKTANIAATGVLRLAVADVVAWRNNANGADLPLGVNGSDQMTFNSIVLADLSSTQTLTNKTLTNPKMTNIDNGSVSGLAIPQGSSDNFALLGAAQTLSNKVMGSTNTLTGITMASWTPDGSHTLTAPTATDTLVGKATTDTLTNKTLTSPTITSPTITGQSSSAIASLGLRDTSAAFDVTIAATSSTALTAGRTLTLDLVNAARTLKLGGNLTLAGAFTTAGAFSQTLTATGTTSVTLPTAGTLATLAGSETFTNKTLTSPAVTGLSGTLVNITGFGIRDTSAAFDATIAATSSTALTAGRTLTLDLVNASNTIKIPPLALFSALADGSAGQILSTLGSGSGYAWASALSSSLNQYNAFIGNASNVGTATNTNLLGDIIAQTRSQTATVTIAAPGVFTATAHGMANGDKFYLTTSGALPTGLTASTTYFAANVAANTFNASTTLANAAAGTYITTSGSQSGTHTLFMGGLTLASGVKGTISGSAITAGYVGEKSTQSRLFSNISSTLTTATPINVTSALPLPLGVWMIYGAIGFDCNGTASITNLRGAISTTSATLPSTDTWGVQDAAGQISFNADYAATIPNGRITHTLMPSIVQNTTASQNYYLVAQASYTGAAAAVKVFGSIVVVHLA